MPILLIKSSESLKRAGAWYALVHDDGSEEKFQGSHWVEKLQDERFRQRGFDIMDEEIIMKFDNRTGNAQDHYTLDDE